MIATWEGGDRVLLAAVMAALLAATSWPGAARGEEAPALSATRATDRAEEARRLREQGEEYAAQDRHAEAIRAYRAAVAADPSLGPEIAPSLGAQLLWADRTADALPVLEAAVARNPGDLEARKLLALAYRRTDRLDRAERLSRRNLVEDPGDTEERNGLAIALQWQGRERESIVEFERVLAAKPDDPEALLGLSRSRLEMDLPEDAERYATRAAAVDPKSAEAAEQLKKVRRRLARYIEGEVRATRDTDRLSLFELTLGVHGRAVRGLDLGATARELFFRQGDPEREGNIDGEDSVDGTAGAMSFAYRTGPILALRGSAGVARYDVAGFRPWTASAGATFFPGDLWSIALDWERAPWDTILSLQNHVTVDTVSASFTRAIPWKTKINASASLLFHRNGNGAGQPRGNRGQRYGIGLDRRLYMHGDVTRLTGLVRLGYLGFRDDLDVGIYDPVRQTTQEVGLDGRWAFRPRWEAFGTSMAGAQQEKGQGGSPTYSLEAGVDREVGAAGRITLGAFVADSSAAGREGGYRRYGGYLRLRVPF